MCGRFSITGDIDFYAEYFGVDDVVSVHLEKSWNVAPTDRVYVVAERDGRRHLATMRWGLVPYYATDGTIHINARIETIDTSPAFRESLARRRCLIPADGFYEWEPAGTGRHPHWVYRADGHPMAFAAIWSTRKTGDDEWDRTCAMVTTPANGVVREIHERMPAVLVPEAWDAWLNRDLRDRDAARGLIRTIDPGELMEHRVSKLVNSVRNNGPELRQPSGSETLF